MVAYLEVAAPDPAMLSEERVGCVLAELWLKRERRQERGRGGREGGMDGGEKNGKGRSGRKRLPYNASIQSDTHTYTPVHN